MIVPDNSSSQKADSPLRFRLYFRLMDLCLIASVLLLLPLIPGATPAPGPGGEYPTWFLLYGNILIFIGFFLTPVLILARFMRDEYAEQLFRRTTDVLVYLAVALPTLLFWAAAIVFIISRTEQAPYPFSLFMAEVSWWSATAQVFKIFCIAFVVIFQFLRWRDSR